MRNKIKIFRAIYSFTQAQLADNIEVSRQTINSIETGKYIPSTVLALKMARVFKVSVDELFELDEID